MSGTKTTKSIVSIIIKTCIGILLLVLVIYLARRGYKFGQDIFSEEGYALSPGTDITISISSGESNMDVAKKLESNGVIADKMVFWVQCFVYEAKFKPGHHVVNNSAKAEDIIELLSKEPETEENTEETEDTQTSAGEETTASQEETEAAVE